MRYMKTFCGIVATLLVAVAFMNTAVAPPSMADSFADNLVMSTLSPSEDTSLIMGQPDGLSLAINPGESIVVEFTDNMLLPSSNPTPDLLIYHPTSLELQYVSVEISSDNKNWVNLGILPMDFGVFPYPAPFPSYRTMIDIDFASLDPNTNYKYVKLTDISGIPGTMIDAIEANPMHAVPSTEEPEEIPEFPTIALPVAAIIGLAFFMQSRKE